MEVTSILRRFVDLPSPQRVHDSIAALQAVDRLEDPRCPFRKLTNSYS